MYTHKKGRLEGRGQTHKSVISPVTAKFLKGEPIKWPNKIRHIANFIFKKFPRVGL